MFYNDRCFIVYVYLWVFYLSVIIIVYIEKVFVEYGKYEWEMGIFIVIRFEDLILIFGNNFFEFCFYWIIILFGF